MVYGRDAENGDAKYWLDNFIEAAADIKKRTETTNASNNTLVFTAVNAVITSPEASAPERLLSKWDEFVQKIKETAGAAANYIVFAGKVNFPANGSASNLGMHYVHGLVAGTAAGLNGSAELRSFASRADKWVCRYNASAANVKSYVTFTGTVTNL